MKAPRISVVIDNYNYGRFLPAAIDSVLSQDIGEPIEIIVVDDGSTDDSRTVLDRYAGKVEAVLQENQGQAAAITNGIRRARGEIVCLLDSDDVWKPEKLRLVAAAFEAAPEAGTVQHFLQDADADLRPLEVNFPSWPERHTIEMYLDGRVEATATSGLSFRRKTALQALPIPRGLRFDADDYLATHCLFLAPSRNIPKALGLHRLHGDNHYAGVYQNARRIAGDLEMRRILIASREELLSRYSKELTPRYRRIVELEDLRRDILYHAHAGRRLKAAAIWA